MVKQTFRAFLDDESPRLAAALSYYTVFALPPLLVLILLLVGVFVDPGAVERELGTQLRRLVGAEATRAIQSMIRSAQQPGAGSVLTTVLSIAALIFGATGAFVQLQTALNKAWNVEPDPGRGGVRAFVRKRVWSFGMVLCIAFLLLVSLVLSAVLSAFGPALTALLPGTVTVFAAQVLQGVASLLLITVLFMAIFRLLPEAEIAWRDVAVGGFATALLFVAGKFGIGFYLGRSDPGSAFGAAGSLAVVLLWIYYSAMILLLGAEFTQVWAQRRGRRIVPEPGARIITAARVPAAGSG